MTDPAPPKTAEKKLELSTAQVTGAALAAMSGAFVASWAGTAGTLIGAALGSVIATVGTATYTYSLRRTTSVVRRRAEQVRQTGVVKVPFRPIADAAEEDEEEPRRRFSLAALRQLPWPKVLVASVLVTVAGLAGITAIEAATGKPVSSYTGGGDSSGTTLGHAVGADSTPAKKRQADPSPAPSPASTSTPTPSSGASPTPTPTPSPSSTPTPTPTPTPGTTDQPTPSPTTAP